LLLKAEKKERLFYIQLGMHTHTCACTCKSSLIS
jgi:hypothetical protein